MTETQRERFWRNVEIVDGKCWNWTSRVDGYGYGHFKVKGRSLKAHRVAWTLQRGPIPDDKTLDHLCRHPECVNPAHIALVSNKENILRGASPTAENARRTHCKRGHELPAKRDKRGRRPCAACAMLRPHADSTEKLSTRDKSI